jgi:L-amino acid N-acyltransferase
MESTNPSSLVIREAGSADIPAITRIFNDAIVNTTAVYFYDPVTEKSRAEWLAAKHEACWPVFVAEKAGDVLGFSTYGPFRPWPAYQYSVEHSVYVHPERRGRGVGKLLVPPLIESAKSKGIHTMIAGIDSSNSASLRLHQHFGFVEVAHFKEVGFKFDRWLDLLFLQLWLNSDRHEEKTCNSPT